MVLLRIVILPKLFHNSYQHSAVQLFNTHIEMVADDAVVEVVVIREGRQRVISDQWRADQREREGLSEANLHQTGQN